MADQALTKVGLFVRLEAKAGRARNLGPPRSGSSTPSPRFAQAHLQGAVASALTERGPELLAEDPSIEPLDILAAKLPALAASQQ